MISRLKLFGLRIFSIMLGGLIVAGANPAFAKDYPFTGFYAYGYSKEAMTTRFLELSCAFRPVFTGQDGKLIFFTFDIAYFRSSGNLRYVITDGGWTSAFDPNSKTIVDVPTYKFDGNDYYAPKLAFHLVQSFDKNSVELITFRGIENFYNAQIRKNYRTGKKGVLIRCPFSEQSYKKYSVGYGTLPPISKEAIDETFRIAEGIDKDDSLLEAVKKQLEK